MAKKLRITVDDVMDQAALPLMGVVPEDVHIILAASAQKPLLKQAKRCEAALAFRRIAKRIQGLGVPIDL